MLKIRLMRIGTKGRPFYRIVAVDDRKKRTGSYLDLIGTYNPLTNPKEIKIDQNKVDEWVKKGAQLSDGFLRILGKSVQKPKRKTRNPGKLRSNTPKEEAPAEPEVTAEEETPEEVAETQTEEPAQSQETEQVETTETTETPAETAEESTETSPEEVAAEPDQTEDTPVEKETEEEKA